MKRVTIALVLLGALRLLWPGDIYFIHDEMLLLRQARDENRTGATTEHGLKGSRGVAYGPLPVMTYRGLMAVSDSPIVWAMAKSIFITLVTVLAVLGLLRLFPAIPPWCGLIPLLSPYLWFYTRDLWDNSFNVAWTAALFVAYLSFLHSHRRRYLIVAGVCAVAAFQTHLLAVPLIAAVALHFVVYERAWLKTHARFVAGVWLAALIASGPYLAYLLHSRGEASSFGFRFASVSFALLGGRLFSGLALEYFLGWGWFWDGPWLLRWIPTAAVGLSAFVFLPTFYGLWQLLRRLAEPVRDLEFHAAFVTVVALMGHLVLVTVNGLVSHPHYYNAVWILFFYCFGTGMAKLGQCRAWRIAGRVYVAALACVLVFQIERLHRHQGNREMKHGSSLSEQLRAARRWRCRPELPVVDERRYPTGSFEFLREISARDPELCRSEEPARRFVLRYRYPEDPWDGNLEWIPSN